MWIYVTSGTRLHDRHAFGESGTQSKCLGTQYVSLRVDYTRAMHHVFVCNCVCRKACVCQTS